MVGKDGRHGHPRLHLEYQLRPPARACRCCACSAEEAPDVLCLQETKTPPDPLPARRCSPRPARSTSSPAARRATTASPSSRACRSRTPVQRDFLTRGDARHVAARLPSGAIVHNLYVPAGGDLPRIRALNPKFPPQARLPRRAPRLVRRLSRPSARSSSAISTSPRARTTSGTTSASSASSRTRRSRSPPWAAMQGAGGWVDVTRASHPRRPPLLLVVLPRPRLAGRRQGPPPRPHLGHARSSRPLLRQPHRPPPHRAGLGRGELLHRLRLNRLAAARILGLMVGESEGGRGWRGTTRGRGMR